MNFIDFPEAYQYNRFEFELINKLMGNQQVRKLLILKYQDFRGSKAFVSAIF